MLILFVVNSIRIQRSDLELFEEIGSGGFGTIYRAKWLINDHIIAVKVLHPTHLNNETRQIFFNELSILNSVRHPNIVTFYGVCLNEEWLALIMEYMPLGSLYQLLHKEKVKLLWSDRLSIALQTAKGINYLHQYQPQILHRDIKSSNLLLENHYTYTGYVVKVCDFGMAKIRNETTRQTGGTFLLAFTLPWVAPEVLRLDPSTDKSDIYSLGIVYWELASSKIPYDDIQDDVIITSVRYGCRLKIPDSTPSNFYIAIEKCWTHEPKDRPTCPDLLKMLKKCVENQSKPYIFFLFIQFNLFETKISPMRK